MSLQRVIQSHISDFESQLYTTLPARVIAFDPVECTVDVQPLINRLDKDGVESVQAALQRVPLQFPSVKGCAITFPIQIGDLVSLHFLQSNADNLFTSSSSSEASEETFSPKTGRHHSINDCVATVGLRAYSDTPVVRQDTLDTYFNETRFTISADGTLELEVKNEESGTDSIIKVNPDGEISLSNNKESSNLILKANGDISGVTKSKFSVTNGSVELVDALSRLAQQVAAITVNTTYGPTPINNKAAVQNIKSEIDTMKE